MRKAKAKVTRAEAVFARREGKYWDDHSLAESWAQTRAVEMDVELQASTLLIHLEPRLAARLESASRKKRLSLETWLNRAVERELRIRPARRNRRRNCQKSMTDPFDRERGNNGVW